MINTILIFVKTNFMNRTLLILFCLISHAILFGQSIHLSGTIAHAPGDYVYLVQSGNDGWIYIDSTKINASGQFTFPKLTNIPSDVRLYDGDQSAMLFLLPGDSIVVHVDERFYDETLQFSGKGAERNNAIGKLVIIEETIGNQLISASFQPDSILVLKQFNDAYDNYLELIPAYAVQFPELKEYLENTSAKAIQFREMYMQSYRQQYAANKPVIALAGTQAPNFKAVDMQGKTVRLSDYKGKITVLDFWAFWCGPCRAEFPDAHKLEEEYGKDINFVNVHVFGDAEQWKKACEEEHLTHSLYIDKENMKQLELYGLYFIPRFIVLDADHKVISAYAPHPSSGLLPEYWKAIVPKH